MAMHTVRRHVGAQRRLAVASHPASDDDMIGRLKRAVPLPLKRKIVGAAAFQWLRARGLARSSKRVDICAAQGAHLLHLAGVTSLAGQTCLEVGSGWVLSHALVFHLLGAERVIATDIEAMARFAHLRAALHQATANVIRDVLSPFAPHAGIRERLNRVLKLAHVDIR